VVDGVNASQLLDSIRAATARKPRQERLLYWWRTARPAAVAVFFGSEKLYGQKLTDWLPFADEVLDAAGLTLDERLHLTRRYHGL
jgi:hypothetical protein